MKLFAEFPPVTDEQWMAVVEKDLKGADFQKRLVTKTLDNLSLKPFYRKADAANICSPVQKGPHWNLREEIREPSIEAANAHIVRCLTRGVDELSVITYPIGPPVRTLADMEQLLDGVWMEAVPIHWLVGPLAKPVSAMLVSLAQKKGMQQSDMDGSVDLDPIMDRCARWVDTSMDTWKADFEAVAGCIQQELPKFKMLTIRGAIFEKAGASLAQELAFSLALFAEYLVHTQSVPTFANDLTAFVNRCEIRFGVGTNYFLEIGKLRAARHLLRNMLASFGVSDAMPTIHAVTTSSNKTLYDPYINVLRATIEAMGSTVGGADSISVAAYDQGYHAPDEFSEHLSRNTQTLLREEAYLDRVADPLGGSYTVEVITQSLADAAWKLFLEIESQGGFVNAWQSGFIGSDLDRIREERTKQVSRRIRKIVGTTVYSNPSERRLSDVRPPAPAYQFHYGQPATGALFTDHTVPTTPLDPFRPSWPYENLRLRVERSVALGGNRPKVLLAMWGDLKMRRARSGFCQSFFAAGGYELVEVTLNDPSELPTIAEQKKASLAVLCTSDDEVLAMAQGIGEGLKITTVVAGNPEPVLEELKALGIKDFVHIKTDLLKALTHYHEVFGVPLIPIDQPLNPEEK
jgi:methylmalonyl-CoA mutase